MTTKAYTLLASLVPRQDGESFPFIRLHETDAAPESAVPFRPSAKVRVQFTAEAASEEKTAANIVATGHKLVGDMKKALFGDVARDLNGNAIDARLEGYSIQPPDPGSDVVIALVRGSFSFHDDFTAL